MRVAMECRPIEHTGGNTLSRLDAPACVPGGVDGGGERGSGFGKLLRVGVLLVVYRFGGGFSVGSLSGSA